MKKFLRRAAAFLLLLPAAHVSAIAALSAIPAGNRTLFQRISQNYDLPGGIGYTLSRFREAERLSSPDLLVIGSSHAFMSFDPQIFKTAGLDIFCMGSTSQTPMNSYFLLKKYLKKMRPKQVLFEIYLPVFEQKDGIESYYDILANSPLSKELLEMALATGNIHAMNAFFGEFFARFRRPLDSYSERKKTAPIGYAGGGYVESSAVYVPSAPPPMRRVALLGKQLDYLNKGIWLCKKEKVGILLVAHPLSREFLASRANYSEASAVIRKIAEKEGVRYFDFNPAPEMDSLSDFRDETHLNASGVKKFNGMLLKELR